MLSQSYSLVAFFFLIAFLLTLYLAFLVLIHKSKALDFFSRFSQKRYILTAKPLILLFFSIGIYGEFSYHPLKWSQAFRTANTKLSHLALNPVLFFFKTLEFRPQANLYEAKAIEKFLPELSSLVDGYWITKEGDLRRKLKSNFAHLKKKPNIIIVLLESLAAHKTSLFGNPLDTTPALAKFAKNSLFYKNFYTSSTSTARSIFASFVGLPDVSKVSTGTENPFITDQHILLNYMSAYKKLYFIGGNASWRGIKAMLKSGIDGLELYEEEDFKSSRNDVWGLSDLDLFRESLSILEKKSLASEQPFFAFIQSAGFHRPYTIPKDRGDFQVLSVSEERLRGAGFISQKQFNSLRFQDYAFGIFMENAKKKSFYRDTIFIIYGDHGLPVKDPQHLNQWQKASVVSQYHVPLLIHAPKFFKPRKIQDIAQQADIMPSVLDLSGYQAITRSYGTSLFSKKKRNFAYSYAWAYPQFISYIDDTYYIQKREKSEGPLNLYKSKEAHKDYSKNLSSTYKKLSLGLEALYEINKYLIYNNKRIRELQTP